MSRALRFRAYSTMKQRMISMDPAAGRFSSNDLIGTENWHVMQWTGLQNSQGVDIYEGDIVMFTYWWFDGNHAESQLTGELVYLPDCMSFGLKGVKNKEWLQHVGGESDTASFATWLFEEADFQVIGNIHEHPELLQGAE